MTDNRIHRLFAASLLLKGAHALLEIAGGVVLLLISTETVAALVNALTREELREDPQDFVASHLMDFAQSFPLSTKEFFGFYLLAHGLVKIVLVAALLREKLWAFPLALTVLAMFVAYQLYRYSYTQATGLLVLSLFDLFVIALIWLEWGRKTRRQA